MKQRDKRGRYKRVYRKASRWEVLTLYSMLGGILLTMAYNTVAKPHVFEVVNKVEAAVVVESVPVPEAVIIEVSYTKEDIERHIRATFTDEPNTAVAVAKCESGLVSDIQSHHILSYGRELSFGVYQIHAPDWHKKAVSLGFENYRTNVLDNINMAYYIYKSRGNFNDWTCYKTGMYKKFL